MKELNIVNKILVRRKNAYIPTGEDISSKYENAFSSSIFESFDEVTKNAIIAATVAKNMESLGYMPDKEMFEKMTSDASFAAEVDSNLIPLLKENVGADVNYHPMYKNFPTEVMNKDNFELYFNAIMHYLSGGELYLSETEADREALDEFTHLKPVHITSEKQIPELFTGIASSGVPYTFQDTADLMVLYHYVDIAKDLPDKMTCKENIANMAALIYGIDGVKALVPTMDKYINNPTDVLRIFNVIKGNGDASLSGDKIRINSMSRPERKIALHWIENCRNIAEEMKVRKNLWIQFGEKLHPGEYSHAFPNAFKAFNSMRNSFLSKDVKTYNAKIENAIRSKDLDTMKKEFSENPGAFARNLDRLVRNSASFYETSNIIFLYKDVAKNISPELLWKIHSHFSMKNDERNYGGEKSRIFTVKGPKPQTVIVPDDTAPIPEFAAKEIIKITEEALIEKYKEKPEMGNIYIAPEVTHCKIPNNTRQSSLGKTLPKGSTIPLEDKNIIRGFVWWTNPKTGERTDIDLSAALLDKNFKVVDECAYYRMKPIGAVHSGDITNGDSFSSKGVAEFVDIDKEQALERGIKYAVFTVHNYTGLKFSENEHGHFGFMSRADGEKGEIFEPSTVESKIKLSSDSCQVLPCLFDLENNTVTWIDDSCLTNVKYTGLQNVAGMRDSISASAFKFSNLEIPDISDVIRINAAARNGHIVKTPEEADIIFDFDKEAYIDEKYKDKALITPYDTEYYSGNLVPSTVADKAEEKVEEKTAEEIIESPDTSEDFEEIPFD